MKKTIFLLILAAAILGAYGQELERYQCVDGKWGFKDSKTGAEIIPCKYDDVWNFAEGLAPVKLNSRYGFVDKTGKEVIPLKYDDVWGFSEGLAQVELKKKRGVIDKTGKEVIPIEYASEEEVKNIAWQSFSVFAKNHIEQKINIWQQKGEFEKTTDWQQRVNETTRKAKVAELLKDAEKEYIATRSYSSMGNMTLGVYDADNETYRITNSKHGDWLVPVPINEAQTFKNDWDNLKKTPQYVINDDQLAIAEMTFTAPTGKTYKYSNQASLVHREAQIDYNFAPIDINASSSTSTTPTGKQDIGTVKVKVGSDVAQPPATGINNTNTFAVIIANENYKRVVDVDFAKNDGTIFKEYCLQTLGLPEKNVKLIHNASKDDIVEEVSWLSRVAHSHKGEASIIFYYAGHGVPDETPGIKDEQRPAYLLPVGASSYTTGYKLDDLYSTLGALPVKSIIVFMDACFSGAQRSESGMIAMGSRGVARTVQPGEPKGNMVVFSAVQRDETAFPYREKEHGMFTYFLLKKLKETKGAITLGELSDYLTDEVQKQSSIENQKSQTPTVNPSYIVIDEWRGMKLPGM
ncbi:MAG: WG repeat-containing protein [Bacteroidales bacterium]|nr:WG repeat-containing protein [Bacteroidales bacterium]